MKKPFVKYNHATIQSTMSKDKSKFLAISNSISSMKTFFSIIVAMLVLLAPAAFAKRGAPAEVKPVVHEGIEYRAPHSTIASEKMGVVEAWDKATDKMLWEKKVYTVKINPLMERDVQDVFVTKLEIDAGKLIVTNEKDARYSIDLKTQNVTHEAANQSTEILEGIVIEKRANVKSYESWNAPSDPFYILDLGNVTENYTDGTKTWQKTREQHLTLRPSGKVATQDLAKLKGKRVVLSGRHREGEPYKPSGHYEQYPVEPAGTTKPDGTREMRPANRGTGFIVDSITEKEK
jgi:hypothetical protein